MNESLYIETRLQKQIDWYDNKSAIQKKWFYRSRTLTIILSASIPVCTGFVPKFPWVLYIISILGASAGIIEGISTLTKLQEKWIEYRSITETLQHEKYMYETSAGVYAEINIEQKFRLLVERVESIISQENINWANMNNQKKGDK